MVAKWILENQSVGLNFLGSIDGISYSGSKDQTQGARNQAAFAVPLNANAS